MFNTVAGLFYECVAIFCGFVIPRFILQFFGSDYNGITSSITQFLSCVALFKMSISGVTRAALYKPLAEADAGQISAILKSTEQFMRKVALIFAGTVVLFSFVYPFFVRDNFDWFFSCTLVLIIAISTFVQYYFGITYQILLEADQKQGVIYLIQIATIVLNTFISVALIKNGASIHVVKLGSSVAFCLNPLLINWYVSRHYSINKRAKPDHSAMQQRWDAFAQAAATFVHNNTSIIVLTLFSTVYEISVFTVYYMVCNGLKTFLKTFTNSIGAAFGNMMAKGEEKIMQKNMDIFEYVGINLTTVIFTIAGIMMLPFVAVYTRNITDVEYIRPWFSVLMVVGMAFFCYRIPYQSVIEAAGHYRQTRNGALLEAVVGLIVSVAAVFKFGLAGVAVGALVSSLIRTANYVGYLSRHIMHRSCLLFLKQMGTSLGIVLLTYVSCSYLGIIRADSYAALLINACICTVLCVIFALAVSLLFYRSTMFAFVKMFKSALQVKFRRNPKK